MNGMLKGGATNKKVVPNVRAEVWHSGMNDYRVVILGIGEYAKCHQLNPAFAKARWLAELNQEDLNHEIAKVQNENSKVSGMTPAVCGDVTAAAQAWTPRS